MGGLDETRKIVCQALVVFFDNPENRKAIIGIVGMAVYLSLDHKIGYHAAAPAGLADGPDGGVDGGKTAPTHRPNRGQCNWGQGSNLDILEARLDSRSGDGGLTSHCKVCSMG
jgi:hypothetical protein